MKIKKRNILKLTLVCFLAAAMLTATQAQSPKMNMTTPIPESISTPDKLETSIGTLDFFDGVPTQETVNTT